MPVTIKDIARHAKVSHSTVSRALHSSPLIAVDTAERIRRTAVELGYLPSAAARSLKTNRTQVLGVILSSVDDPFFGEILRGIEEIAQNSGYSLFIAASQRDPNRERNIVQAMREHSVDGVIICSASFSGAQSSQLHKFGIPIVVVNNQSAEDYRYSIFHDDVDGSRQLTRHLIGLGHRRIAYLGNSQSGRTTVDRLNGFKQEMDTAELPIDPEMIFEVPGGGPEEGLMGAAYFLALQNRPTALICFNDMLAAGVLQGLLRASLHVPADMSVTGFDNIVFSAFTSPPLTTFDQPKRFIGAEAASLVLDLLKLPAASGQSAQPEVRVLKGRLLVRGSTGPPPALPE